MSSKPKNRRNGRPKVGTFGQGSCDPHNSCHIKTSDSSTPNNKPRNKDLVVKRKTVEEIIICPHCKNPIVRYRISSKNKGDNKHVQNG